jgi:CheY-like chemotaxis protein
MKTVCVVDDDPDTREALRLVLELSGYDVIEASDGAMALAELHRQHAGVILLDLMMPGMTGSEFLERQHADPELAAIPVVVLSGVGDVRAEATRLGASAWVRKPVELDELMREVDRFATG